MIISSLKLKNFRSYRDAFFEFGPETNIIVGPNACGKTTIVEAIYLLITGKSFRSNQLKDIIHHEAEFFEIDAVFKKQGIEQTLRFVYDGQRRHIVHNETTLTSTTALLGILQGVVMTPDDVSLIKGAPALRRRFIDLQLAQVDPNYVRHLTRYTKAMQQKNALLRQKDLGGIDPWEEEMVKAIPYIISQRRLLIDGLRDKCCEVQKTLSQNKEDLTLNYKTAAPVSGIEQYYLQQYRQARERELTTKSTYIGPHRDDIGIYLQGNEARHFGSEGQQRSAVAALRFAEWNRLSDFTDELPMMLIDDVGVSLDSKRRAIFFSIMDSFRQVFLTTTDFDHSLDKGLGRCVVLEM